LSGSETAPRRRRVRAADGAGTDDHREALIVRRELGFREVLGGEPGQERDLGEDVAAGVHRSAAGSKRILEQAGRRSRREAPVVRQRLVGYPARHRKRHQQDTARFQDPSGVGHGGRGIEDVLQGLGEDETVEVLVGQPVRAGEVGDVGRALVRRIEVEHRSLKSWPKRSVYALSFTSSTRPVMSSRCWARKRSMYQRSTGEPRS
jgi:hypothetical protein